MKHLIRDLLVNIIWYSGVTRRYASRQRQVGPLVRVICFHDVPDRQWFSDLVKDLKSKYHIISPEDLHNKNFDQEKINILFTFDDGYQSWVDLVAPVLNEHNLKGLFFISSGLLEIAHDKDAIDRFMSQRLFIKPRQPLTWEGAQALLNQGHTIGGHTINHKNTLTTEAEELPKEVGEDKRNIESKLNVNLKDFAYPFGTTNHINDKIRSEANSSGYEYTYSALPGFVSSSDKDIPRLLINDNQSIGQVNKWIEGAYDVFYKLKSFSS